MQATIGWMKEGSRQEKNMKPTIEGGDARGVDAANRLREQGTRNHICL